MNLDTITMPKAEARRAFLEYRSAVRERHNDEDEAIMAGYRSLSRGHQLLRLTDTICAGGVDDKGLPRLAVMRADQRWCWVSRSTNGYVTFRPQQWIDGRHRKGIFRFPEGTLPAEEWRPYPSYRAIVPTVPPALRPKASLSNYVVLWEAEWHAVPRPPGDPALLRRITGDLYAVLAVWDLTPLEQAVLGARSTVG